MNPLLELRTLGRSQIETKALGFGASYSAPVKAYEEAFELGFNYFYWGTYRRDAMAQAIRNLAARKRDRLVIALQSYARIPKLVKFSLTRGLKKLRIDYADVLILGWHNKPPSENLLNQVVKLKQEGLIKAIAVSCHNRATFQTYIEDSRYDIVMVRYNAAHTGAEKEVFPLLDTKTSQGTRRDIPGVISYTATRWGYLVNPKYTPSGYPTPTAADCYRFALSAPQVNLCLSGPSSLEQMRANLKGLEKGPMSLQELEWMRTVGKHVYQITAKKRLTNPFMQRQP